MSDSRRHDPTAERTPFRLRTLALKRGFGYAVVVLIVCLGATSLSLDPTHRMTSALGALSNGLMAADLSFGDLCLRLGPPFRPSGRVVIVDVAPHRPGRRFSFPQPRGRYGVLLERLFEMGASVVAFDLVFQRDTERPEQDQMFLKALRAHAGRVVVARLPIETAQGLTWGALGSGIEEAIEDPRLGPGHGTTIAMLDVDSVLRRIPIVWEQTYFPGGRTLPVVALSRACGQEAEFVDGQMRIGTAATRLSVGGSIDLRVPDYRAAGLDVSMDEVLEGACDPRLFHDAIVVVMPPVDMDKILVRDAAAQQRTVPGGYVVAAAMDALLQGRSLQRAHDDIVWICVFLMSITMAVILWFRPSLHGLLLGVCGLSAIWIATVIGVYMSSGMWLDAVVPGLAMVATGVGLLAWDAALLRGVFARFLPQTLVDHALSVGFEREHQKGTVSDATVVFVDLQGYTGISEHLSGQELVSLVNDLHQAIGSVFEGAGGTIVDYMGDAQMIVFGIPKPMPEHARAAVQAALGMPAALEALNQRLQAKTPGAAALGVGIGIASGPVTWGFIGAYGHQEFAALGDTTNTAARLQSMTRAHDVMCLVARSTYEQVKDEVRVRHLEGAILRGKSEQQDVYALLGPIPMN